MPVSVGTPSPVLAPGASISHNASIAAWNQILLAEIWVNPICYFWVIRESVVRWCDEFYHWLTDKAYRKIPQLRQSPFFGERGLLKVLTRLDACCLCQTRIARIRRKARKKHKKFASFAPREADGIRVKDFATLRKPWGEASPHIPH